MPKGVLKEPRTVVCKVCRTPFSAIHPGKTVCSKECRVQKGSDYMKAYKLTSRYKEWSRNAYLLGKYGITTEQYDAMLEAQGGGCAICKRKKPDSGKQKWFHVDHVELFGGYLVRGILCNRCNSGIGMFAHCPELMLVAIKYLMDHEEDQSEL